MNTPWEGIILCTCMVFMFAFCLLAIWCSCTSIHPGDLHWVDCEPYKDCVHCHGTGKVEIVTKGSVDMMGCSCTQELKGR